jgi:hypothetical protein
LIEIGLADEDGAFLLQALHDRGRTLGNIGKLGTGAGRRQPGHVDVVLDGEGDAVERPARSDARLGKSRLLLDQRDPIRPDALRFDARIDLADNLFRCRLALGIETREIVQSPENAISCFLRTQMDVLVLGDFYITDRNPAPR